MWFSLYDEINRLALSSDDGDTSIILSLSIYAYACIPNWGGGTRDTLDLLYRRHGARDPSMYSGHIASRAGRGFQGVRQTFSLCEFLSSGYNAHQKGKDEVIHGTL